MTGTELFGAVFAGIVMGGLLLYLVLGLLNLLSKNNKNGDRR